MKRDTYRNLIVWHAAKKIRWDFLSYGSKRPLHSGAIASLILFAFIINTIPVIAQVINWPRRIIDPAIGSNIVTEFSPMFDIRINLIPIVNRAADMSFPLANRSFFNLVCSQFDPANFGLRMRPEDNSWIMRLGEMGIFNIDVITKICILRRQARDGNSWFEWPGGTSCTILGVSCGCISAVSDNPSKHPTNNDSVFFLVIDINFIGRDECAVSNSILPIVVGSNIHLVSDYKKLHRGKENEANSNSDLPNNTKLVKVGLIGVMIGSITFACGGWLCWLGDGACSLRRKISCQGLGFVLAAGTIPISAFGSVWIAHWLCDFAALVLPSGLMLTHGLGVSV